MNDVETKRNSIAPSWRRQGRLPVPSSTAALIVAPLSPSSFCSRFLLSHACRTSSRALLRPSRGIPGTVTQTIVFLCKQPTRKWKQVVETSMDGQLALHTSARWGRIAAHEEVTSKSIHDVKLNSASKIRLPQFLLLRVLWQRIDRESFQPHQFGLDKWVRQASHVLKDYKSWNLYYENFDDIHVEGNFFLAKLFQTEAANGKGRR